MFLYNYFDYFIEDMRLDNINIVYGVLHTRTQQAAISNSLSVLMGLGCGTLVSMYVSFR